MEVTVQAKRVNAHTWEERVVNVTLMHEPGDEWVYMSGGPTGWESFSIISVQEQVAARGDEMDMTTQGWLACGGTPGRWDACWIEAPEMRHAFHVLGLSVFAQSDA